MSSSPAHSVLYAKIKVHVYFTMFRYLLSFFLFSGGGHIDQNRIFDYNVKKNFLKLSGAGLHAILICTPV